MASEIERAIIELQILYRNMYQRLLALEKLQRGEAPASGQAPPAEEKSAGSPPPPSESPPPAESAPPPPAAVPPQSRVADTPPMPRPLVAAPPPAEPEYTLADYNARVQRVLQQIAARKRSQDASLENIIGQLILSFVGALVLFGGILLFLRYSFDQPLLQPANRVLYSLVVGAGMLAAGQWFAHLKMRPLSAAITAIGIATLLAALYAANIAYEPPVLPRIPAFAATVAVCAAGVGLAFQLRLELLAIVSLLGMFLTPLVLRTADPEPIALVGYLGAATLGGLVVGFFRRDWLWLRGLAILAVLVPLYFRDTLLNSVAWLLLSFALACYTILTGSARARGAAIGALILFALSILFSNSVDPLLTAPLLKLTNFTLNLWMLVAAGGALYSLVFAWLLDRVPVLTLEPTRRAVWAIMTSAFIATILWYAVTLTTLDGFHTTTLASLLWILALNSLGRILFTAEDAALLETGSAVLLVATFVKWLAIDATATALQPQKVSVLIGTPFLLPPFADVFVLNALLLILAYSSTRILSQLGRAFYGWLITAVVFIAAIVEIVRTLDFIFSQTAYPPADPWLVKHIYISIFAAIYALAISVVGFARKYPTARWVALGLFAATVLKVLIVDMAKVDNSLRILSFTVVGLLLLIVSFLYHKTGEPAYPEPSA